MGTVQGIAIAAVNALTIGMTDAAGHARADAPLPVRADIPAPASSPRLCRESLQSFNPPVNGYPRVSGRKRDRLFLLRIGAPPQVGIESFNDL